MQLHQVIRLRTRYQALKLMGPEFIERCKTETQDMAWEIVRDFRTYPPVPPPPNKYERTYKLYDSWDVNRPFRRGNVLICDFGMINNPPHYWKFVQGPGDYQRSYHKEHGWKSIEDVSYAYEGFFAKVIDITLKKMWRYL